jgi:hypothetical protein
MEKYYYIIILFWFIIYLYNKNYNMKNKLFLEEGEIARILNMHKRAIREELNVNGDEFNRSLQEGPTDSGQIATDAIQGFMAGGIVGSAVNVYLGLMGNYSFVGANKILKACDTKKAEMGQPTMNPATLAKIADDMNYGVEGVGTYEKTVASALRQTQNIPNLCAMAAIYKQRHGEGLFDALNGDIDSPSQWKTYVFLPLLDVYNKSVELGKKMKQQQPKVGGGGSAPTSGEVYQKCHTAIIDPMVKKYGYTYVTLDVFNQAPADKKTYKWCPAGKSNVYFTKGWSGGSTETAPTGTETRVYSGGGGGGGKTYTFDVAAVNKLIDEKCSKDGKPGGTGVNLDATGTPTPTPIPNMPTDVVNTL